MESENTIEAIDYAYDQDYFYFEQYYDDKYGKDRAINLLSFNVEWKKAKQQILQGQRLLKLLENCTIDLTERERSLLDLLLEQSKQQSESEVDSQ